MISATYDSDDEPLGPREAALAYAAEHLTPDEIAQCKVLFRAMDENGDGELEPPELLAGLTKLGATAPQGCAISLAHAHSLVVQADANGNGMIDEDEFIVIVAELRRTAAARDDARAAPAGGVAADSTPRHEDVESLMRHWSQLLGPRNGGRGGRAANAAGPSAAAAAAASSTSSSSFFFNLFFCDGGRTEPSGDDDGGDSNGVASPSAEDWPPPRRRPVLAPRRKSIDYSNSSALSPSRPRRGLPSDVAARSPCPQTVAACEEALDGKDDDYDLPRMILVDGWDGAAASGGSDGHQHGYDDDDADDCGRLDQFECVVCM